LLKALTTLEVRHGAVGTGTMKPTWAPARSHGYTYWGSGERCDAILELHYAPLADRTPF